MSRQQRIVQQVEVLMERVRSMKPGGDLDGLIIEEIERLNKVVYEQALAERSQAATKAAFPPCGVSGVRLETDTPARGSASADKDAQGSGGL